MNTLKAMQVDFLGHVLEEGRDLPEGWTARHEAGMAIYRGGYRARLIDMIGEIYERTRMLSGDDAFCQAAINHVIAYPPAGWSIDEVGAGFADSLADLYPHQTAWTELARIEEAMHAVSSSADAIPFTMQDFEREIAGFAETDQANLRLCFMPGLALVPIIHDWIPIWDILAESSEQREPKPLGEGEYAVIWREDEQPVFVHLPEENGRLLSAMLCGATFHDAIDLLAEHAGFEIAAAKAGEMLGQWLNLGLVAGIR